MSGEHDTFVSLILEGDRRRAEAYARHMLERHGVAFLYETIVQAALEEIGKLWESNKITVADEHLASAAAQSAVAALYPTFPWPVRGPRALIACAQGERHEFGARMVADLLALDGWDDRFLGADVPVEDLARKVQALAPKFVGLSVTLPLHAPFAEEAITRIRASAPAVKILLGGRVTAHRKGLAASLHADAIASSATEAVEVARAWK